MSENIEDIELEISEHDKHFLVVRYLKDTLSNASFSLLNVGNELTLKESLYDSLLNESVVMALTSELQLQTPIPQINTSFVYCSIIKEGIHRYPQAAWDILLDDVSFLANTHMHYFYIKIWVEVKHDDRDIEFIQLRRWLESLYNEKILQLDNKSCEMISHDLADVIKIKYPHRKIKIDVSEDNINGSYNEYN